MPSYWDLEEELLALEMEEPGKHDRHMPWELSPAERERRSLERFNESLRRNAELKAERVAEMKANPPTIEEMGTTCPWCHRNWDDCIATGCD